MCGCVCVCDFWGLVSLMKYGKYAVDWAGFLEPLDMGTTDGPTRCEIMRGKGFIQADFNVKLGLLDNGKLLCYKMGKQLRERASRKALNVPKCQRQTKQYTLNTLKIISSCSRFKLFKTQIKLTSLPKKKRKLIKATTTTTGTNEKCRYKPL